MTISLSNKENQRQSNIELLRIFAMLMIIAHHVAVHSGFNFSTETITFNRLWIQFIQGNGKVGVNLFVLISGYFGIKNSAIKYDKVVKLWLQLFTYAILCFCIAVLFLGANFETKPFLKLFAPITFPQWWFASAYFVLYLLSPYINLLLNSLNQKAYRNMLLLMLFMWCIVPTFLTFNWQANNLVWFVFLYALAGYIRLHIDISKYKSLVCLFAAGSVALFTYLLVVAIDYIGTKHPSILTYTIYFYDMQRLPVFIISLLFFVGFLNLKIDYCSFINIISSACFGVYLIHDNNYIRYYLWQVLFRNSDYSKHKYLFAYTILQIFLVFVICTVIELFRIYTIEKLYAKGIARLFNRRQTKLKETE